MADKAWIQKAASKMRKKGTVGLFTRKAKMAGYDSALAYARVVMRNKGKHDAATRKQALFAINANK